MQVAYFQESLWQCLLAILRSLLNDQQFPDLNTESFRSQLGRHYAAHFAFGSSKEQVWRSASSLFKASMALQMKRKQVVSLENPLISVD